jgi:hypothetical protein
MATSHRVELGVGVLALLMIGLTNCAFPQESPSSVVDGALRAGVDAIVAPEAFRSGVLPPDLAAAWTARAEAEYQLWFAGPALDQHLTGLRNVVAAAGTQPGPIVVSVDMQGIDTGTIKVEGDSAHVEGATVRYRKHFAPDTWSQSEESGVTECFFDLHRDAGRWRVVTDGCNVSGG